MAISEKHLSRYDKMTHLFGLNWPLKVLSGNNIHINGGRLVQGINTQIYTVNIILADDLVPQGIYRHDIGLVYQTS